MIKGNLYTRKGPNEGVIGITSMNNEHLWAIVVAFNLDLELYPLNI